MSGIRTVFAVLLAVVAASAGGSEPGATLAVVNARIWTGDPLQPWAEAIAVSGERILAVSSNAAIRKLVSPSTRLVDGNGNMLTPGFIDAHFHLLDLKRIGPHPPLSLYFVTSKAELVDSVAARAAAIPEGTWIFGHGWNERKWGGELPTRQWIDTLTPDHPVWLTNIREDAGLANTAALRAAGITRATKEPPEGGIVCDTRGEPTGLIRGGPMWLVDAVLAERDRDAVDSSAEEIMRRLTEHGVTSVQHSGNWEELLVFQRLHKAGRLRTRLFAAVPLPAWTRLRDHVAAHGRGDEWLHWGGLKLFGMSLASDPRPSEERKPDRWSVQFTLGDLYTWISGASQAGLQVMVHGGGDDVLRIFDRVRREQNLQDPRFRIEHAHNLAPETVALFATSGAIASVQPPLLAHFDHRTKIGVPLPKYLFPCRDLLEAGVVIAFGTDAITASSLTPPLESIRMALERPGPDGRPLTFEECLRAYTRDAACEESPTDCWTFRLVVTDARSRSPLDFADCTEAGFVAGKR